jgi:hypothetical protein
MHHLNDLRGRSNNYPGIQLWCALLFEYLQSAVHDIRMCAQCYAELTRATIMIYLILANKTKDGFDMSNFLVHTDGSFMTFKETQSMMPLCQMARLMQVLRTLPNYEYKYLMNINYN